MKIIKVEEEQIIPFSDVPDDAAFRCAEDGTLYIKVHRNTCVEMRKDKVNCIHVGNWGTACLEPDVRCYLVKATLEF